MLGAASPDSMTVAGLLSLASEAELQQWHNLKLDYASAAGDIGLREQIAADYKGLNAEHIVTFAGAQEAMFAVYHALLKPGDRVRAISPHFGPLHLVAEGCGARLAVQTLDFDSHGRWSLDVDHWCQSVASTAPRMAVINFPHNPTGAMLDKQQLGRMVAACAERDCWLFSDEVFRGLEYRDQDRLPAAASLYKKAVSLGVVSKSHGLGGVRVGWIACRDRSLIQRLLEIKEYLSVCNGRPDELLALIAIRNSDRILGRHRKQAKENLSLLEQHRAELPHLVWSSPKAGILLYPQIADAESSEPFVLDMLDRTGTLVIPGHCFGAGANHIRIGYGRQAFNWQALSLSQPL